MERERLISVVEARKGWLLGLLVPYVALCSRFPIEDEYWGEWGEWGVVPDEEERECGVFGMLGQSSRILSAVLLGKCERLSHSDASYLAKLLDGRYVLKE